MCINSIWDLITDKGWCGIKSDQTKLNIKTNNKDINLLFTEQYHSFNYQIVSDQKEKKQEERLIYLDFFVFIFYFYILLEAIIKQKKAIVCLFVCLFS